MSVETAASAQYDLFVSFATPDESMDVGGRTVNVVEALKRALESHTHPQQNGRRFRACTYREDFELKGNVSAAILDRLHNSKSLLVLCSEAARDSRYVRQELADFERVKPEGPIIAARLRASPEDTFPERFAAGTLGADLSAPSTIAHREWRRQLERESHKIVARVWGLPLEKVFDRFEQQRAKRRRRVILALGVGIMLLSCALAVAVRQYLVAERSRAAEQKAREDAEFSAWSERGARATVLAAQAGREVEALTVALGAAEPALKSSREAPAQAFEGLVAAIGAAGTTVALKAHRGIIDSVSVSPDGKLGLTASLDHTARVWDLASGRVLWEFQHDAQVLWGSFSPKGSRVVTASSDTTARVWSTEDGQLLAELHGHDGEVNFAAFGPRGENIVTASEDGTARVWNWRKRTSITLSGHRDSVTTADFSPDGSRVVTASGDWTARVFDILEGHTIATLTGHKGAVNAAVFSPDGRQIATGGSDGTLRFWDGETGAPLKVLTGHAAGVNSVAYSPGGHRLVTASDDNTAIVWSTRSGEKIVTLRGHTDYVNQAVYSGTGARIATASDDETIRLWDATFRGNQLAVLRGHTGRVWSVAFVPKSDLLLSGGGDKIPRIWRIEGRQASATLKGHSGAILTAAFSPDGKYIVTAAQDNTVRIWDKENNSSAMILNHPNWVTDVVFSPTGKSLLTVCLDGTARIWSLPDGQIQRELSGHTDSLSQVAFSNDGALVVTADKKGLILGFDATTGEERMRLNHPGETIVDLRVLSKGLVYLTTDGHDLWARQSDGQTSNSVKIGRMHSQAWALLSPDGQFAALGGQGSETTLWSSTNGKQLRSLEGSGSRVQDVVFSRSGELLAVANRDGSIQVWDVSTGKQIVNIHEHKKMANSIALSPDGQLLLTGSRDHTAHLYDLRRGKTLARFLGHTDSVDIVGFSPNGERVLTAGYDRTARVYSTKIEDYYRLGCAILSESSTSQLQH